MGTICDLYVNNYLLKKTSEKVVSPIEMNTFQESKDETKSDQILVAKKKSSIIFSKRPSIVVIRN